MHTLLFRVFLGTFFCVLLVLPVHADMIDGDLVTIQGVVTSTEFGLVLNDGATDYLLLGVSDAQFEGMTCEVNGVASNSFGIVTINVESIEIIGDASSHNYSMLLQPQNSPSIQSGTGSIYPSCREILVATGSNRCSSRLIAMCHIA